MLRWSEFRDAAPDIASVGEQLLFNPDHGEVAILATVDEGGRPSVAPFCPIFTEFGMYILAGARTPKVRHLSSNGRYALHALVGADDTEFQMSGAVRTVEATDETRTVLAAIPFPSFDASDPVFEFLVDRALAVTWPAPGSPRKSSWPRR